MISIFSFFNQFQMQNHNIPLAIILKRTQNGYTFQSLQEINSNKEKNKKLKAGRKPAVKGFPNRLIKQIGLHNDQMASQITPPPEVPQIQPVEEQPQQNQPLYQVNEQQQVSCEVDRQTQLPKSPAIWFDKTKIHSIQKNQFKQFFVGSTNKNPQIYTKYRNFIIQSYQKNPKRYLTKIACRRILRGDVNTIMKIHTFLQRQGIINFCVNYDGNYVFKHNSLTKQYEQKTKPQTCLKSIPQNDEQTAQKQVDTDNMTITVINKNFSRTYRAICTECRLVCGIVWFANVTDQQNQQKNICFQCFNQIDSNQKVKYEKVDITKKMQSLTKDGKSQVKNTWNIDQNMKLLDFMSNSQGQSWKSLLQNFNGKRTVQDIVLQFIQFPISNIDNVKSKKQWEKQPKKQKKSTNLGFDPQDYKSILQQFYINSQYGRGLKSSKQIKSQRQIQMKKLASTKIATIDESTSKVSETLKLTMENLLQKLQNLKSYQNLINQQSNKYESLVEYRKNQVRVQKLITQGEMILQMGAKQTSQLSNKSRSKIINGDVKKLNDSSQFLEQADNFEEDEQL